MKTRAAPFIPTPSLSFQCRLFPISSYSDIPLQWKMTNIQGMFGKKMGRDRCPYQSLDQRPVSSLLSYSIAGKRIYRLHIGAPLIGLRGPRCPKVTRILLLALEGSQLVVPLPVEWILLSR